MEARASWRDAVRYVAEGCAARARAREARPRPSHGRAARAGGAFNPARRATSARVIGITKRRARPWRIVHRVPPGYIVRRNRRRHRVCHNAPCPFRRIGSLPVGLAALPYMVDMFDGTAANGAPSSRSRWSWTPYPRRQPDASAQEGFGHDRSGTGQEPLVEGHGDPGGGDRAGLDGGPA